MELLAYVAAKFGGDSSCFTIARLDDIAARLQEGVPMEELAAGIKTYDYYYEAYSAVLGGFLGTYEVEVDAPEAEGGKRWERTYGLKAFSPIAKNYPYNDYDDFGSSRSYGYKRKHLGHDICLLYTSDIQFDQLGGFVPLQLIVKAGVALGPGFKRVEKVVYDFV